MWPKHSFCHFIREALKKLRNFGHRSLGHGGYSLSFRSVVDYVSDKGTNQILAKFCPVEKKNISLVKGTLSTNKIFWYMKQLGVLSTVIGLKKLSDFWKTLKNAFEAQKLVLLGTHCASYGSRLGYAHDIIGSRLEDLEDITGFTKCYGD